MLHKYSISEKNCFICFVQFCFGLQEEDKSDSSYSMVAGDRSLTVPNLNLNGIYECLLTSSLQEEIFSHTSIDIGYITFITNEIYEKCNLTVLFGILSITKEIYFYMLVIYAFLPCIICWHN